MSDNETGIAILVKADPKSYLSDVPAWEPRIDDAILASGQNLTKDIGLRLVRRSDTGAAIATVGMDYTIASHRTLAGMLDSVTAPFGGRELVGPARVFSGAHFTAMIKLPAAVAAALSTGVKDHSKRAAGLTLRASHDGTRAVGLSLWAMRLVCSNGAVAPGSLLSVKRRHTQGINFLPEEIATYAKSLPAKIESYGAQLASWSRTPLTLATVQSLAKEIAGKAERVADKIIDMVVGADGHYVPTSEVAGSFTALQLFEASTAYDRHVRVVREKTDNAASLVRVDRMIDGDTIAAVAWDVLSKL